MNNNEAAVLSVILEYELDEMQAKAYRISLYYLEKARKMFPEFRHHRMRSGDPRKSDLWRHCYKLVRERGSQLKDDIKLYIHAQFDILKHISKDGHHPNLVPSIISSDKAWNRWLLWKSKYDKVKNFATSEKASNIININKKDKVIRALDQTKMYLFTINNRHSAEDINNALDSGDFWLWVTWGKVCYYYLLLSPLVQQWLERTKTDLLDKFTIDASLYKPGITDAVEAYFRKEFEYEF